MGAIISIIELIKQDPAVSLQSLQIQLTEDFAEEGVQAARPPVLIAATNEAACDYVDAGPAANQKFEGIRAFSF